MTQLIHFERIAGPCAPGDVLREKLLDGLQLSQADLARALGISCPRLNMILKGRCQISAEVALRIERVFDISPHYWLRIRNEFELYVERQRISDELQDLRQLNHPRDRQESAWAVSSWQQAAA